MYGCDLFGYESMAEECTNPKASGFVSAAFFVFFVIISSLGLLTLFVSVVTTSMDEAKVWLHASLLRGSSGSLWMLTLSLLLAKSNQSEKLRGKNSTDGNRARCSQKL
jgi:hypothetical protein